MRVPSLEERRRNRYAETALVGQQIRLYAEAGSLRQLTIFAGSAIVIFKLCKRGTRMSSATFLRIRNRLAGRAIGLTRDDALMHEVVKCLVAHRLLYGERVTSGSASRPSTARALLRQTNNLGEFGEEILLDDNLLEFVLEELDALSPESANVDPFGDLFEAFAGAIRRGAEGQFFTPPNAAHWLAEAVSPGSGDSVIDPACGAGGFLAQAYARGATNVVGVDKDSYLVHLTRARFAVLGKKHDIRVGNSLTFEGLRKRDLVGAFDVVLTNPPFGKNIVALPEGESAGFKLAYRWAKDRYGSLQPTSSLARKTPPQVLFVERVLSLLKVGGRAGIVLPESVLSNRSYAHVVAYLRQHAAVQAVVGMPESLFKTSGKGGTHTKTALLVIEKGKPQTRFFMAEAKWCGNDSRGRQIDKDDLPKTLKCFHSFKNDGEIENGFLVDPDKIHGNILSPRYHEPAGLRATNHLSSTHELILLGDLVDNGLIDVKTGDEVGRTAYGTGPIPFVRTSDLSNWEIKIDPKHCVSEEIFEQYNKKQDVRTGDVLMVRDGTYLIGTCALVTEYDKMVYQSHILKFRCKNPDILNPYLFLAILSSQPVQTQIKSKTFTQDIIDSLGVRYRELILPVPKSAALRERVSVMVEDVIRSRSKAKEDSKNARFSVAPPLVDLELA